MQDGAAKINEEMSTKSAYTRNKQTYIRYIPMHICGTMYFEMLKMETNLISHTEIKTVHQDHEDNPWDANLFEDMVLDEVSS